MSQKRDYKSIKSKKRSSFFKSGVLSMLVCLGAQLAQANEMTGTSTEVKVKTVQSTVTGTVFLDENKKMFKVSEHTAKPPYILGNFPRIEIIFTCIDEKNEVQYLPKKDKYEKLSTLKILLDNGTLTQQEFEKEKNNILNN